MHQVTIATKNCVLASGVLSAYLLLAPGVSIACQSHQTSGRDAHQLLGISVKSLLLQPYLPSPYGLFSFSLTSKECLYIPSAVWTATGFLHVIGLGGCQSGKALCGWAACVFRCPRFWFVRLWLVQTPAASSRSPVCG